MRVDLGNGVGVSWFPKVGTGCVTMPAGLPPSVHVYKVMEALEAIDEIKQTAIEIEEMTGEKPE